MRRGLRARTSAASPERTGNGRAGYALFFVLSLILLLSLLLTSVARDSRQQARAALRTLKAAEAHADAETVLSLTIMHLLAAKPDDRWPADGRERPMTVGGRVWRVTVTPEDGKVDINHAEPPLLSELFTAAGAPPDEAAALADRVADWRDPDDLTRLNGAERRAYDDANLPPPRNGPFLKPQEIRRVMGLTEDLYACIAGAITVYSGKAGIDRRYAPELLRGKAREPAKSGAVTLPSASPLAVESVAGKVFTIELVSSAAERPKQRAAVIIRLTEHSRSPWWLLEKSPSLPSGQKGQARCVSIVQRTPLKAKSVTPRG